MPWLAYAVVGRGRAHARGPARTALAHPEHGANDTEHDHGCGVRSAKDVFEKTRGPIIGCSQKTTAMTTTQRRSSAPELLLLVATGSEPVYSDWSCLGQGQCGAAAGGHVSCAPADQRGGVCAVEALESEKHQDKRESRHCAASGALRAGREEGERRRRGGRAR